MRGGTLGLETGQMLHQHALQHPLKWRMDTLPFIDISFQHIVSSFSFHSLSLFCFSQRLAPLNIDALGLLRASDTDQNVCVVSFPPLFIFASSAAICFNERAGHIGHFYFFFVRHHWHSSSLAQPPFSSIQAWIFIFTLGDLPSSELFAA